MLQNGAVKVYSVDVGHGQLAWKLVQDERVICMDRTNIRYVTPEDIDDVIESVIIFAMSIGFDIINLDFSPVKGPEGNIEYLLYLQNTNKEQGEKLSDIIPEEVVEKSHQELDNRGLHEKVLRYNR